MGITVSTQTIRVRRIRRVTVSGARSIVPCPVCRRDVPAVTPDEAIRLLRANTEGLEALIALGRLHTIVAANGEIWICRDSIFPNDVR